MPNRLVVATLGLLAIASTDAAKKEKELEEGMSVLFCDINLSDLLSKPQKCFLRDVLFALPSALWTE
jgi:hypothetical protein